MTKSKKKKDELETIIKLNLRDINDEMAALTQTFKDENSEKKTVVLESDRTIELHEYHPLNAPFSSD